MNKIKVLVTGASGLVGSRFIELAQNKYDFFTPEYPEFDLTDPSSVKNAIDKFNPEWIVNFAAFTDVNAAETQTGDNTGPAWKINVEGTENLVNAFPSKKIIHISTDMVFPGSVEHPGPYSETDKTPDSPENLTWYGWTKNRAEKVVLNHGGTILRIIYPVRAQFDAKLDYIRGAVKKYVDGTMYPLFNDQQICIAFIDEVAQTLEKIIDTEKTGIFHCCSDTTTPFELITYVVDQLGGDPSVIKSSSIHTFLATQTNKSRYPVFGGLKTVATEKKLGLHFSAWQTVVEILIGQGLSLK
ncbi:MAG TPA: sugar nucleotide-binding protein [Candidatus Woesebacteria bacterium]|nr:sugar nucleotide-binding protein [Candidatus Woesebacteria bacterium]